MKRSTLQGLRGFYAAQSRGISEFFGKRKQSARDQGAEKRSRSASTVARLIQKQVDKRQRRVNRQQSR